MPIAEWKNPAEEEYEKELEGEKKYKSSKEAGWGDRASMYRARWWLAGQKAAFVRSLPP